MTQREAFRKWCPMARHQHGESSAGYPIIGNDGSCCIADDCAMWVWDKKRISPVSTDILPESEWEGHCGAAR